MLQIRPVIAADQNVYACQDKAYNLDTGLVGSIRDRGFREFWMDGKDKFMQVCPSRDCNHHCVANACNQLVYEHWQVDREHLGFV